MDYVVWLDSKCAHSFAMKASGVEKSVVKRSGNDHHTHDKKDAHHDSNSEHYYRDLAQALKGAERILLMGPGLAKNHFQDHLKTHEKGTLGKAVIGVENFESFEHKSEKQMLATAHDFFKTYNLFNRPT